MALRLPRRDDKDRICRRVAVTRPTVGDWKRRYAGEGVGGLTCTTDDVEIVLRILEPLPERLGVTHWPSRLLARELGLSNVQVAKVWREYDGANLSVADLAGANLSTTRDCLSVSSMPRSATTEPWCRQACSPR
jgi:hypothetical protein